MNLKCQKIFFVRNAIKYLIVSWIYLYLTCIILGRYFMIRYSCFYCIWSQEI